MSEAVLGATLVIGVLMIVVLPSFRMVDDFPSVRWDMVLVDVVAGVVFTALGAALAAITYVAVDWLVLQPIRELLVALSMALAMP